MDDFLAFGAKLSQGLKAAGYTDGQAAFGGSSVSGVKYTTGAPFDVGRISDYDIGIASPDLLAKAKQLGIGLRGGGKRTGPLTSEELHELGLDNLADQLSEDAGREVNFMIYDSLDTLAARGQPYVVVPNQPNTNPIADNANQRIENDQSASAGAQNDDLLPDAPPDASR